MVVAVGAAWLVPSLAFAGVPAFFLATVLALGSADRSGLRLVPRPLRWIGDITYSTYLLHVPCQILLMTVMDLAALNRPAIAGNLLFFLAFFAGVIGLSWLTFRHVERPAQAWLRQRFGLAARSRSTEAMLPAP
jgi:peptidoglycan/LPS O-acetylase OafA/YrhL